MSGITTRLPFFRFVYIAALVTDMVRKVLAVAALVVLVLVLVWYYTWSTSSAAKFADGTPVSIKFPGSGRIYILRATYGSPNGACRPVNVTRKVTKLFAADPEFVVSPAALGVNDSCNEIRELTIRFKARRGSSPRQTAPACIRSPPPMRFPTTAPAYAHFMPVPELTCGPDPAPEYAVDVTGRGAAGTVVWEPFTTSPGGGSSALSQTTKRSPSTISPKTTTCPGVLTDLDSDIEFEGMPDSSVFCQARVGARSNDAARLLMGELSDLKKKC